jgi:hypothetical protein
MLEGRLKGNGLQDILTKIHAEYLTGVLTVQGETEEGQEVLSVQIRQGRVLHVNSPTRPEAWKLGQLLQRGGYVSEVELHGALQEIQETGWMLGMRLVESQALDKDHLAELLHVQFLEDMHRCLRWEQGGWRFEDGDIRRRKGAPSPLNLKDIVEVSQRQRAEWGKYASAVPSDGATFKKLHNGPIATATAQGGGLEKQELRVFSLIHPSRTVMDLVALGRLERFEVYRSLFLLTKARLIEVQDPGEAKRGRLNVQGLRRGVVHQGATVGLALAALLLGVWIFLAQREHAQKGSSEVVAMSLDPWEEAMTQAQLQRLKNALESYAARSGDYPVRLEGLVEAGLLEQTDLTFPGFESPYVYQLKGDAYLLVRPKR